MLAVEGPVTYELVIIENRFQQHRECLFHIKIRILIANIQLLIQLKYCFTLCR